MLQVKHFSLFLIKIYLHSVHIMKLRRNIFNLKFMGEETAWEFFYKSSIRAVFTGD